MRRVATPPADVQVMGRSPGFQTCAVCGQRIFYNISMQGSRWIHSDTCLVRCAKEVKIKYQRTPQGYLAMKGSKIIGFLERGARMSDGGTNAWLIWFAAIPGEIDHSGILPYVGQPRRGGSYLDPVRQLAEIAYQEPQETSPWFVHRFDAGSLAEAKITFETTFTEES